MGNWSTAEYNIHIKRGDTLGPTTITVTDTDTGDPVAISSAFAHAMNGAAVVHDFAPTVGGSDFNIVTLPAINRPTSDALPVGRWPYDLELELANGDVRTYISGTFIVEADVTRRTNP